MILGIDPGVASSGWAVLDDNHQLVVCGCIKTKKIDDFADRLSQIYHQVQDLCREHKVNELAIESIFFAKNAKTAIVVAQAMGVIKAAASSLGIKVFDYTPLQIKIAITGYGRAEKCQVAQMVQRTLEVDDVIKNNHAADAAAAALTHIFTLKHD